MSELDKVAERAALEATLDRVEELERIVFATNSLSEAQARLTSLVESSIPRLTKEIAALSGTVGILTAERDRLSAESRSQREQIERLKHELSLSLPRFVWRRLARRVVD